MIFKYSSIPQGFSLILVLLLAVFVGGAGAQAVPEDSAAKIISGPPFVMSEEAIAAGFDGEIAVALTINDEGQAKNVIVFAGPMYPCGSKPGKKLDQLREAVKANVAASRFASQIKKGKPVSSDVMIKFALRPAKKASDAPLDVGQLPVRTGNAAKILSSGVLNGKALSLPKPRYPREARAKRASGAVTVSVLVDEQGKVISAGATSGDPLLQEASRDSACGAKFAPTTLQGQPVKITGVITYNFVP